MPDSPKPPMHVDTLKSLDNLRQEVAALVDTENASTPKDNAPPKDSATLKQGSIGTGSQSGGTGGQAHGTDGQSGGTGGGAPPPESSVAPKREPISHEFVVACCRARDKGNGVLYAALMRNKMAFVPEQKQWLEFAGHHWEPVYDSKAEASVERVAERYVQAEGTERDYLHAAQADSDKDAARVHENTMKALNSSVWSLHSPQGVGGCLKFALGNDDPLIVPAGDLDDIPMRLGCRNGIVDMRTGQHRPGRPEDYVTRIAAFDWAGMDAPCPVFREMIYQIVGEREDVARYFQKVLGYALAGRVTEKIIVILLGEEGDSGKTTIFEILLKVFSGYAKSMPVELLLDQGLPQNPNSPTPAIMALRGQRITWASEPGEGRRFSVDRVKLMTGCDSLTGRYPWDKAPTEFDPTHTLFLLTNHKMRASAHDAPFWSRVRLIDCPFSFVPEPNPDNPRHRQRRDNLRDEILATEGPGILAYAVEGYQLYLAEGLTAPVAVRDATQRYRREEDLLAEFMDSCLQSEDGSSVQASDIYDLFKNWFIDNYSRNTPSITTFGKLAQRHMRKERRGGKVYYLDVEITAEARGKYGRA